MSKDARAQSVGGQPVGDQSVGGQPVGDQSVGGQPVGDQSVGGQPVGDQSVGGQPVGDHSAHVQSDEFSEITSECVNLLAFVCEKIGVGAKENVLRIFEKSESCWVCGYVKSLTSLEFDGTLADNSNMWRDTLLNKKVKVNKGKGKNKGTNKDTVTTSLKFLADYKKQFVMDKDVEEVEKVFTKVNMVCGILPGFLVLISIYQVAIGSLCNYDSVANFDPNLGKRIFKPMKGRNSRFMTKEHLISVRGVLISCLKMIGKVPDKLVMIDKINPQKIAGLHVQKKKQNRPKNDKRHADPNTSVRSNTNTNTNVDSYGINGVGNGSVNNSGVYDVSDTSISYANTYGVPNASNGYISNARYVDVSNTNIGYANVGLPNTGTGSFGYVSFPNVLNAGASNFGYVILPNVPVPSSGNIGSPSIPSVSSIGTSSISPQNVPNASSTGADNFGSQSISNVPVLGSGNIGSPNVSNVPGSGNIGSPNVSNVPGSGNAQNDGVRGASNADAGKCVIS
ncbi:MAG: hypothetical protein QW303_00240 [Nitrososphaerota archaeon]